jgi:hypothetical protein
LVAQAVEVLLTCISCSRQQAAAVLKDVAHDRGMTLQSYAALVVECTSGTGPPGLTQARDLTSLELSASRNARKCLSCGPDADRAVAVPAIPDQMRVPMVQEAVGPGVAGSSARRQFDRRKAKREAGVRARHPRLGGLILAVTNEPQSTRAWERGAVGEERLGTRLDTLTGQGTAVLHDRRIPGSRANIDHIAVTANGVWVIDAKRYQGRPTLRVEGGIPRPRVERLLVGTRDCTKLVDGALRQVDLVRAALEHQDIPVAGALCFLDADWPLIGGAFTTRGIQVLWPNRLAELLTGTPDGPVDAVTTCLALAEAFPAN